jgi:tetratricopeptide (TPR) repeat protein
LALGFAADYQMRFAESEGHFVKALSLDSSNAIGHMWHATNLLALGEIDDAVAEMRKASQLDPLSAVVGGNLSFALAVAGKLDEARTVGLRTLEIDSTAYTSTYDDIAEADVFNSRVPEALRLQLTSLRLNPEEPGQLGYTIFVYAAAGDWKNVRRLQSEILNSKDDASKGPDLFRIALVFGDKAEALTLLEHAFAKKSFYMYSPSPGCDPYLNILKDEPRYISLMHSAGMKICPVRSRWPIGLPG